MLPLFRFSRLITVIFFLIAGYSVVTHRLDPMGRNNVIAFDAKGYCAYLPAVFIYHDLKWDFVEKVWGKYYPPPHYYDYRDFNGHRVNKYFCGEAVMQTPFFLCAMAYSCFFGYPVDGFSTPFHVAVAMASVFYFALGIYFLARLLMLFGVRRSIVAAVLVLIAFATNLFYYAVDEPGMSHVYSFCAISGFLLYLRLAMLHASMRYMIKCAVLFGFVCIIRPTNALVIFAIPVFAGSWSAMRSQLRALLLNRKGLLLAVLAGGAVISIQLILFYLQCGRFFIWSYGGVEQFYLSRPELFNVLFSYKKGLFLYTPLVLVSLFGLYYLAKESVFSAVALFLLLYAVIYLISCWWLWFYGGSWGMRPFIDYYPFVAILLGYLLSRPKKWRVQLISWAACLSCLYYTHAQMDQYRHGMVTYYDMDEKRFWGIFLKPVPSRGGYLPANTTGAEKPGPERVNRSTVFFNDFDRTPPWHEGDFYTSDRVYSGNKSTMVNKDHNYSPSLEKSFRELGDSSRLMVQVSFMAWPEELDGDAVIVTVYKHGEEQYNWKGNSVDVRCSEPGTWNKVEYREMLQPPRSAEDKILVYIYQLNGSSLYIDDLNIEFDELK